MIIIFRIKDYKPKFYSNCKDFINYNKLLIDNIIGQELISIHWVWDDTTKTWLKEFPVVIKLSNGDLSLCANNYSDFSIGWNNIDFEKKLDYQKDKYANAYWREYNSRYISEIKTKTIESVEVINFLPRFINDFPIYNKSEEKIIRKMGFLHGFGININNRTMVISNGLDDNNIVFFDREFPNYYTRIIINKLLIAN